MQTGTESFTVTIYPDPDGSGEFNFELDINLASAQRIQDVCATIYHLVESGDIHKMINPSNIQQFDD